MELTVEDYYRWHDLYVVPDDMPENGIDVVMGIVKNEEHRLREYPVIHILGEWFRDDGEGVIMWRYLRPEEIAILKEKAWPTVDGMELRFE